MDIMGKPVGTKIKHKKTNQTYILGDYVNDKVRVMFLEGCIGSMSEDYIHSGIQSDYEVVAE